MSRRSRALSGAGISALVAAIFTLVAGPMAAPGSSNRVAPSFDGACEISGVATFDHPVTNETEANGGRFRSQDGLSNCVGELSAGGEDLGSGTWPVRARARVTGPLSCISGTLNGRARITVLDGEGLALRIAGRKVKGWARIEMRHAVAAGGITFFGAGGSRAEGVYHFTPSASAVAGCAAAGDTQLPMAVRFATSGAFQTR